MRSDVNKIEEVPVNVNTLHLGDAVIIADYTQLVTRYAYGKVTSISPTNQIITVGGVHRYARDGYVYTSQENERFTQRLLQVTDELVSYMHRQDLLKYLHNIIWEIQSTTVLEATYNALVAGMAMDDMS